MTTLADVTRSLAEILGDMQQGTATGGTATTLLDTGRSEPNDHWNGGTIWVLSGDNAGKTRIITDWVLATGTFTFATMTTLCAAGNLYAALDATYPRWLLIQSINRALQNYAWINYQDTSITTVEDQAAYNLPSGVYNIKRVEIATNDAEPYGYQVNHNWREISSQIVFDTGHEPDESGDTIRLTYQIPPDEISADTDTIDDQTNIERLTWEAAVHALRWRLGRTEGDDTTIVARLNEALKRQTEMQTRHPIADTPRDTRLASW